MKARVQQSKQETAGCTKGSSTRKTVSNTEAQYTGNTLSYLEPKKQNMRLRTKNSYVLFKKIFYNKSKHHISD